jgi:hypothetical protein
LVAQPTPDHSIVIEMADYSRTLGRGS